MKKSRPSCVNICVVCSSFISTRIVSLAKLSLLLPVLVLTLLTSSQCLAQGPCYAAPGATVINLPLRNNPDGFEPACEPQRIRVNDRIPTTIRLVNISPVEICISSLKPPTITTATSPLETIINTVAGLKSFDFEPANLFDYHAQVNNLENLFGPPPAAHPGVPPPPETPDQLALDRFQLLAGQVVPAAQAVMHKQVDWQTRYQNDMDALMTYLSHDYRGGNYSNFDPDHAAELATARAHIAVTLISTNPGAPGDPPSELDYAPLQAIADEMKSLEGRLITACTTPNQVCNGDILDSTGHLVDQANAYLLVAQDNFKELQTAQQAVAVGTAALHKIYVDYENRVAQHIIGVEGGVLVQYFRLGTDYGATDTGTISCSTDATPSVATTDAINYSILYQNIPEFTVSAGILTTFLEKQEIGTTTQSETGGTTYQTIFAVTDSARASVFPMAYVNVRTGGPKLKTWLKEPNNELVIANNLSAGIGVNSNTGTNQSEFFAGDAVSFSRVYVHFGAHWGRTESLGGGFALGNTVPAGFTGTPPIIWSYHPAFAIGLSVRIAPF